MANHVFKKGSIADLTIAERAELIKEALSFQNSASTIGGESWVTDDMVMYMIKMLMENGQVFISKKAYQLIKDNPEDLFEEKKSIKDLPVSKIVDQLKNGTYHDKSITGVPYLQQIIDRSRFTWEHVVPSKTLYNDLVKPNLNDPEKLSEIIDKFGMVCIVTKDEDNLLNCNRKDEKGKAIQKSSLRDCMPGRLSLFTNPWARYADRGIEVMSVSQKVIDFISNLSGEIQDFIFNVENPLWGTENRMPTTKCYLCRTTEELVTLLLESIKQFCKYPIEKNEDGQFVHLKFNKLDCLTLEHDFDPLKDICNSLPGTAERKIDTLYVDVWMNYLEATQDQQVQVETIKNMSCYYNHVHVVLTTGSIADSYVNLRHLIGDSNEILV